MSHGMKLERGATGNYCTNGKGGKMFETGRVFVHKAALHDSHLKLRRAVCTYK